MTDTPIPREAVDAAARQLHTGFVTAAPIEQHNARETAMEALTAALPLLLAVELEQIAKRFGTEAEDASPDEDVIRGPVSETYLDAAKKLRTRAARLRREFRG